MLQQGRPCLVAFLDGDEEVRKSQHHLGVIREVGLPNLQDVICFIHSIRVQHFIILRQPATQRRAGHNLDLLRCREPVHILEADVRGRIPDDLQDVPGAQPKARKAQACPKHQHRRQPIQHDVCQPFEVARPLPPVVELHDGDECARPKEHAKQPGADVVHPLIEIRLPSYIQVAEGQCHQAHNDGLDVQLARKDGHVERHEGLGGQGPQLNRGVWGGHVSAA
mmetsp:Transcript_15869/g.43102  ORF Transcript_15869/g.43102 Transcript_15869/m.43102 type:complete len:223 (+) Transcript_15869:3575-4243(+)